MPDNVPSTASEYAYEDRIVALIDVLGWKDLVGQNPDKVPDLVRKAIDRMQLEIASQIAAANSGHQIPGHDLTIYEFKLADGFTNYGSSSNRPNEGNFQLNLYSDHLLLSCETARFAPCEMIGRLSSLLWTMFANGLFIRGAVVVGKLFHSDTMVVGPALVRAHELESTVVNYPRVVVDDALEKVLNCEDFNPVSGQGIGQPIRRDRDGLLFIDHLRRRFLLGEPIDKMETWIGIRDSLVQRLKCHREKPKILTKDGWMISYFNDVVREIPRLASLEIK